jgi:hypothetical protein
MTFFLSLLLSALLLACDFAQAQTMNVQRVKYYNSSNTCEDGVDFVISEVVRDFGAFGGRCFSGRCSLTAQTQEDNTITSLRSCQEQMEPAPQAFRQDLYFDAECSTSRLHTSNGYTNVCYPGTRSGLAFGQSSRFACDAQGNIFDMVFTADRCAPTSLALCQRLNPGPANECVPDAFSMGAFSQRSFCPQPEVLPALCYPSTTSTASTTATPTTIPGLVYDVNRDGQTNLLDICAVLDQWGEYQIPSPNLAREYADIAPLFGVVDVLDLTTVTNYLATLVQK